MIFNDTLSSILALEGWYIANKIMLVLNYTNIMVFMLAVIVFQVWFEVAQEGEDEGNKGLLSLNRSETRMTLAFIVCFFAVVPLFPANVNTLTFDKRASSECGVGISSGHTNASNTTFNDERVFVPIWWALWHSLSQGLTNASVSAIPCSYDIQRSLLQLSKTTIQSEPLKQEVQDFYQQCYTRARIAMKAAARKGKVTAKDFDNANWIGANYFLNLNFDAPKTTYHGLQSEHAVFNFPFKAERDEPRQKRYRRTDIDPQAAYPSCYEWWTSAEDNANGDQAGLRWRIAADVGESNPTLANQIYKQDSLFDQLMGLRTSQLERIDMLIERVLSVENLSSDGRVVRGYGAVLDKSWDHEVREVWNASAGWAGLQIGHILSGPGFFIVREAMPMLQAALMSFVIIASPIILTISTYNMSTLMSLSLVYGGLAYLTFWWELCRSLDSKLLEALYQNHENLNPITGTINALDDGILKFVIIILYVLVPAMWFGLLGFTGYKVNALGMDTALEKVNTTVDKSVDKIANKGISKM